jgi:hypothetical protein
MLGVKPVFEEKLRAIVYPIEQFDSSDLARRLDQSGVDAFYYDQAGDTRTLGSRVRYSASVAMKPTFSMRYARLDTKRDLWDTAGEFYRKARALTEFKELIVCPKLHVESFSKARGSGKIGWSFAVNTEHLVSFIYHHWDNEDLVRIEKPKSGETRQVIYVEVCAVGREFPIIELGSQKAHHQNH